MGVRGHHRAKPRFSRPSSRPPMIGMRNTTKGSPFLRALRPYSAPGPNSDTWSQCVAPPMRDATRPVVPPARIASATMAISLPRTQMRNAANPRTGRAIKRRCRRSETALGRQALSRVESWRAGTAPELVARADLSIMTTPAYSQGGRWPYCGAPTRVLAPASAPRPLACLPRLHRAVDIHGEPHWDGGYAANPPLIPLVGASRTSDVLLVHLIPTDHAGLPVTRSEIDKRLGQITFNSLIQKELEAIGLMKTLVRKEGESVSLL